MLVAPQVLEVKGDATISFDGTRSYTFHDLAFKYPSQTKDEPRWVMRTEPFQPKVAGITQPIANVGFTVKDKNSPTLDPTYGVGDVSQLTTTAYNGYSLGADASADFTRRATYTSSDPSVAQVDSSGKLTAMATGKTTITARYDWTTPLRAGDTRSDYVLATMLATVD